MPAARNPKTSKFSVNLAEGMNERLERLADKAGANKTTMAGLCIAAGLNILERAYLMDVESYVAQATADKVSQFTQDLEAAGKNKS